MGNYIKNFETEAQYNTFKNSNVFPYVNVSYISDTDEVKYTKDSVDTTPFTITINSLDANDYPDGTTLTFGVLKAEDNTWCKYSTDGGSTWTKVNCEDGSNITIPVYLQENDSIQLIGNSGVSYAWFHNNNGLSQVDWSASGNIMSLVAGDGFAYNTLDTLHGGYYKNLTDAFVHFRPGWGNSQCPTDASNLWLPQKGLTPYCFNQMFKECSNLQYGPEITAIEMPPRGCCEMFSSCPNLQSTGAITVKDAYSEAFIAMFKDSGIVDMPVVSVETAHDNSVFQEMFNNCYSLEPIGDEMTVASFEGDTWSMFYKAFEVGNDSTPAMQNAPMKEIVCGSKTNGAYFYGSMYFRQVNLTSTFEFHTEDTTQFSDTAKYNRRSMSDMLSNTGVTSIEIYGELYPFKEGPSLTEENGSCTVDSSTLMYDINDLRQDIPASWTITQNT